MITLNGHLFVRTDKEFTETLFRPEGTAYGYVKKQHAGCFLFMDMQKVPFAALINNGHTHRGDEPFFVSCSPVDGSIWYMQSTSMREEKLLGLPGGFAAGRRLARQTWDFLTQNWRVKDVKSLQPQQAAS